MMDKYSVIESNFKGHPVIEILKNDKEFGAEFPSDQNFKFGVNKAKMIVAAMDIIKQFYNSKAKLPKTGESIKIKDDNIEFHFYCTKYDEFEFGGHKKIHKPYLELDAEFTKISFGLVKTNALIELEEEIKEFAKKDRKKDEEIITL